jgi:mannosylglycerate hydrolase
VCIVPHTHWDREWYRGAPAFRQRLLALVDALLEPDRAGPFLLDGQGITLNDYLTVRPERRETLAEALREGRLEAGPWYVLADNLIPSGEAIIRNLEAGKRALAAHGAVGPAVAYCPDTFGHPAALPTIAHGFGLPVAVAWRGAGGRARPHHDACWWRGPDGTTVLLQHLPPDGYEFGRALPVMPGAAATRWQALHALWRTRAQTGIALLLNGADHHARQPDLAAAVAALQQAASDGVHVAWTTLQQWATRYAAAADGLTLPTVSGELRDSYGYTWTLGGTLATRAHQKRENARLERGLLRDVEPWLALVRMQDGHGGHRRVSSSGRLTMAQLPVLLDHCWQALLATHPHDTLCGCSIDAVARAMEVQQEGVAEQARGVREAALQLALVYDPVAARAGTPNLDATRLVLRNRSARKRGGLAILTVHDTLSDAPAGPASAQTPRPEVVADAPAPALGAWVTQPIGRPRLRHLRRESPQHYPDNDLVREHRLLAWVPPLPPLGLLALNSRHMRYEAPPAAAVGSWVRGVAHLDNGLVHIAADPAAGVTIISGDRLLHDALWLETQTDAGDSYTPAPRGAPQRLTLHDVRLRDEGPLRAAIDLVWRQAPRHANVGVNGAIEVVTTVLLTAGSRVVECRVRGRNHRTHHRLRLVWHTDVEQGEVLADAALGPVPRSPIVAPDDTAEAVPDGMPLHRWVLHADAQCGATLISDGLAEAAVAEGRMAVTLLRAVGHLSRPDLPERPGHAGWPEDTPEAQCQGVFAARTALLLHGPLHDATLALVRDAVEDVLLPLVGESWRDLELGATPVQCSGPALSGPALEASAVTLSQQHPDAIVLRAVNWSEREAVGCWTLPDDGPWEVTRCRLDETALDEPALCDRSLEFPIGARAVVTYRVRRALDG